jgi:hypothetical protein
MSSDSQNQKPEWMELAESDAPATEIRKTSKKLPAIAVLVTGAVIATGAFLANASESKNSQSGNPVGNFQPGNGGPTLSNSDTSTPNGMKAPGIGNPDGDGRGPDGDGDHHFGDGGPRPDDGDGDHHFPGGDRHHDGDRGPGTAPKIPSATSTPAPTNSNA